MHGGISGLHHGAVNAVDWEASLAFYRDALGLRLLGTGEASGPLMEAATGRPGIRLRWAMFEVGAQHFELIQYLDPPPGPAAGATHDGGATHLAFKVKDVDEAYRDLSARGVRFIGTPVRYSDPVPVGGAFAYALDPSGVLLEFIEDVNAVA
ncbi:hypothetical protein BH23CHL8_BH23CHL8_10240 [soil metagenome]